MSPPDSERSRSLPTLTWESLIDPKSNAAPTTDAGTAAPAAADTSQPTPVPEPPPAPFARPLSLDEAPGAPGPGAPGPLSLSLHLGDVSPVPPPPAPPVRQPTPVEAVEEFHLSFSPLTLPSDVPVDQGAGAPAGQAADSAVPSLAETSSDTTPDTARDVEPDIDPEPEMALPTIREATPVQPYVSDEIPVQPTAGALDTTVVAAIDAGAAPLIPGSQPGPIVLPLATQPDQSGTRAPMVSPLAVDVPQRKPRSKRRARSGLRLVMVLIVLAAIVGCAIVFGRPYLFPEDWAGNAEPYANAVEEVTGAEFVEPLTVTAEPTEAYQTRSTAQIAGDWSAQLPTWRALGLATGEVTDASLADLLAGWEPAMYSTTDGQIYHDDALTGTELEAQLTLAMATAWLDQEFGWAIGQDDRTLDAAAMTSAYVRAQATAIQQASAFDAELAVGSTGPLAYLPSVISYEALAPAMYAPLLPSVAAGSENPLSTATATDADAAYGSLGDEQLVPASAATLTAGDVVVGSPETMDRSFWYLVFAGFLDAPTAYGASESIVESSLTVTQRAVTTCAYATFSGGDLIQTPTLRTAMESWVAHAPVEMSATFSVGADGALQMQSCDPGAHAAVPAIRLGAGRELVGWRSAELATIEGVIAAGGGEAQIAAALERLAVSDVGEQLATGPVDQSPADAAAAARAAVETIVTPPPPPVVEPAD